MTDIRPDRPTPRALLTQLSGAFAVFRNVQPLAVGIHKEIRARLPDIDPALFRRAMKLHTDSTRYLQALANGKDRHDLDGQPSGVVTPEQQALAAGTVRERTRKAADRRKAEAEQQKLAAAARERQEKLLQLADKFNSR